MKVNVEKKDLKKLFQLNKERKERVVTCYKQTLKVGLRAVENGLCSPFQIMKKKTYEKFDTILEHIK